MLRRQPISPSRGARWTLAVLDQTCGSSGENLRIVG
jgi:hypothetical protein